MTNLEPPAPQIRRLPLLALMAPAAALLAAVGVLELHNAAPAGDALLITAAPLAAILTVRPPWRVAICLSAAGATLGAGVYLGGVFAVLAATALILVPCIKPTTRWIHQIHALCQTEPDTSTDRQR